MNHDLVRRYWRLVARCDARLAEATAAGDAAGLAAAAENAEAARAALSELEEKVLPIEWANALWGPPQ